MIMNQNFERRHSPNRRKTRVPALVIVEGATVEASILDVSFRGLRLDLMLPLAPGTPILIHVLGHELPAIVHWSRDNEVGAHLLERLERDLLVEIESAEDDLAAFR